MIDLLSYAAFFLSVALIYGLMTLGFNAEAPVGSTGNVQRRVRSLTRRDLLIAISFGQCLRDTVSWYASNRAWWEPLRGRAPVVEEAAWSTQSS